MTEDDFKKEWSEQEFKDHIWERIGRTNDLYPNWMMTEFCNHWMEKPGGRAKMWWQLKANNKKQTFVIPMRVAQWKTRSIGYGEKRWKDKDRYKTEGLKAPVMRKLTPSEEQEIIEIKKAYARAKAAPKVQRGQISMVKQQMINMGRPVFQKQEDQIKKSEEDFQRYKRNLLKGK